MIRKLLLLTMAIPVIAMAQVSNPEKTYIALPQSTSGGAFTATANDYQDANPYGYSGPDLLVDGNNATFWETTFSPAMSAWPFVATIDMKAAQDIDGIYYVNRNNSVNSPSVCTVETSSDGTNWTQQGGTRTISFDGTGTKMMLKFSATVNCQFFRIICTENFDTDPAYTVVNLAELGAIATSSIPDNTAWNRVGWIVTASDQTASFPASNTIDVNDNTFYRSDLSSTNVATPFPHKLTYDMGAVQAVNRIYWMPRNQGTTQNGAPVEGSIAFSDDGVNWGSEITIPIGTQISFTKHYFNLPSTQTHRFFRLTFTKNNYSVLNPTVLADPSNPNYYLTQLLGLTEVGANYNATLGTNDFDLSNKGLSVQAYPNPSSSEFSLRIESNNNDSVNVRVFDITGKLVQTIKTTAGNVKVGSNLNAGIYMAEIAQGNAKKTVKLIKQ
jgi:hypothetical protein